MNGKKKILTFTASCFMILIALLSLSACGASNKSSENGATAPPALGDANATGSASDLTGAERPLTGGAAETEQKIIKTAGMSVTVKSFDDAAAEIKKAAEDAGGYVESSNSYVSPDKSGVERKNGNITVRVPSDSYDTVKSLISTLGKVTSENENSDNVTGRYYDIQARMTAKQAEETRLLALIDKADNITDLIALEDRLSSVRGDIGAYQTQLDNIDGLASFSTINVALTEQADAVIEPVSKDFSTSVKNAFVGSISTIKTFFEYAAIFIADAFLPLVFIGVIAAVIIIIVKKQNNKNKKHKGDEKNE